jgi:hypothetical protein
MLQAAAEKNRKSLQKDRWHYVWVLAKKSSTTVI